MASAARRRLQNAKKRTADLLEPGLSLSSRDRCNTELQARREARERRSLIWRDAEVNPAKASSSNGATKVAFRSIDANAGVSVPSGKQPGGPPPESCVAASAHRSQPQATDLSAVAAGSTSATFPRGSDFKSRMSQLRPLTRRLGELIKGSCSPASSPECSRVKTLPLPVNQSSQQLTFDQLDTNQDGVITRKEWNSRLSQQYGVPVERSCSSCYKPWYSCTNRAETGCTDDEDVCAVCAAEKSKTQTPSNGDRQMSPAVVAENRPHPDVQKITEETEQDIQVGLVRTMMSGVVSEETQFSIKAGLLRSQIEGCVDLQVLPSVLELLDPSETPLSAGDSNHAHSVEALPGEVGRLKVPLSGGVCQYIKSTLVKSLIPPDPHIPISTDVASSEHAAVEKPPAAVVDSVTQVLAAAMEAGAAQEAEAEAAMQLLGAAVDAGASKGAAPTSKASSPTRTAAVHEAGAIAAPPSTEASTEQQPTNARGQLVAPAREHAGPKVVINSRDSLREHIKTQLARAPCIVHHPVPVSRVKIASCATGMPDGMSALDKELGVQLQMWNALAGVAEACERKVDEQMEERSALAKVLQECHVNAMQACTLMDSASTQSSLGAQSFEDEFGSPKSKVKLLHMQRSKITELEAALVTKERQLTEGMQQLETLQAEMSAGLESGSESLQHQLEAAVEDHKQLIAAKEAEMKEQESHHSESLERLEALHHQQIQASHDLVTELDAAQHTIEVLRRENEEQGQAMVKLQQDHKSCQDQLAVQSESMAQMEVSIKAMMSQISDNQAEARSAEEWKVKISVLEAALLAKEQEATLSDLRPTTKDMACSPSKQVLYLGIAGKGLPPRDSLTASFSNIRITSECISALTGQERIAELEAALAAREWERAIAVQELEDCSALDQERMSELEAALALKDEEQALAVAEYSAAESDRIRELEDALASKQQEQIESSAAAKAKIAELEAALAALTLGQAAAHQQESPNTFHGRNGRSFGVSPTQISKPRKWALRALVHTQMWSSLLWRCVRSWRQEASVHSWCTETLQILEVTRGLRSKSNSPIALPSPVPSNADEVEQLRKQLATLSSDFDQVAAEASSAHAMLREIEQHEKEIHREMDVDELRQSLFEEAEGAVRVHTEELAQEASQLRHQVSELKEQQIKTEQELVASQLTAHEAKEICEQAEADALLFLERLKHSESRRADLQHKLEQREPLESGALEGLRQDNQELRRKVSELIDELEQSRYEMQAAERAQSMVLEDIDRVEREVSELQVRMSEKDAELLSLREQLKKKCSLIDVMLKKGVSTKVK